MAALFEDNFETLIETALANFKALMPPDPTTFTIDLPCFGGTVFVIRGVTEFGQAEIIYNGQSNHPFEILIRDRKATGSYRWVHPAYRELRHAQIGEDYLTTKNHLTIADETLYDTESIPDILDKTKLILAGEDHDHKVVMVLDLSEEHLAALNKLAVSLNMSLDDAITEMLRNELKRIDKKAFPDGKPSDTRNGI